MPSDQLRGVVNYLHHLVGPRNLSDSTDEHLLERFALLRDETAFAAVVHQYGPLVFGVCRRILHNEHDAEDAFQATFLVLARKARSISKPGSLRSWLHAVACRVALRAKATAARREATARQGRAMTPRTEPMQAAVDYDLRAVLDEEVSRLPERYRLPILLCYLEGKTFEETARHLRCPLGTVATRLARAKDRLRRRLTSRGLTFSAAAFAAKLSENVGTAAVPPLIADATFRAALGMATGQAAGKIPAHILALTEETLKAMKLTKLKLTVALFLVLSVVGLGSGVLAHRALDEKPTVAATGQTPGQPVRVSDKPVAAGQKEELGDGEKKPGRTLTASVKSGDDLICQARTTLMPGNLQFKESVIAETMMNYEAAERVFEWRGGGAMFQGVVPTATKKMDTVAAGTRTQVWNTCESVDESESGISFNAGAWKFRGQRWCPQTQRSKAIPGITLYGKLFDGDQAGTLLVTFSCNITDKGTGVYEYAYVVANSSASTIKFNWAGLKGRVEPGKTFTHKQPADKLTEEVAETAWFTMGETGLLHVITAHFWQRP